MTRKPMIAGNWKMNELTGEAVTLAQAISFRLDHTWAEDVDVVVCPPFTDLKQVSTVIAFDKVPIALGAQNVFWEEEGAYTGEISPKMLADVECTYCIIGHSERRQLFAETDQGVNLKAKALLSCGIAPIICCGESDETKTAGATHEFVCDQIQAALDGISRDDIAKVIIAYEPIWAIGTGRTPTPEDADEVCGDIRGLIAELYDPEVSEKIRILYGGSMKPSNVHLFMPMTNIDGGLIGGASLQADDFMALVKACLE